MVRGQAYRVRPVSHGSPSVEACGALGPRGLGWRFRWMRNLFLHGRGYGDWVGVRHVLLTWTSGLGGLLLLPWSLLLGKVAVAAWLLLVAFSLASRLRFVGFTRLLGVTVRPMTMVQLPVFLFVDWLCAVKALLEVALVSPDKENYTRRGESAAAALYQHSPMGRKGTTWADDLRRLL